MIAKGKGQVTPDEYDPALGILVVLTALQPPPDTLEGQLLGRVVNEVKKYEARAVDRLTRLENRA